MSETDNTEEILRRHQDGDSSALPELMVRDAEWIRSFVRRKLSPPVRRHADSMDVVQEAFARALDALPRIRVSDKRKFRALMGTIVARRIASWAVSPKVKQHADLGSTLDLDGAATAPEVAAERGEEAAWVRLAVQLLEENDRRVVQMRHFDELSFAEVGIAIGVSEDAARMRFGRAMKRLTDQVLRLKAGRVEELLDAEIDE